MMLLAWDEVQRQIARDRERLTSLFLSRTASGPNGCLVWTATRFSDQGAKTYGAFPIRRRQRQAHRVAYELFVGPIPLGMSVCHRCDNPPCVNTDHLFLGTNGDNIADKMAKGRHRTPNGEQNGQSKLSADQVRHLRVISSLGLVSNRQIGEAFGVAEGTVRYAVGRGWKAVD